MKKFLALWTLLLIACNNSGDISNGGVRDDSNFDVVFYVAEVDASNLAMGTPYSIPKWECYVLNDSLKVLRQIECADSLSYYPVEIDSAVDGHRFYKVVAYALAKTMDSSQYTYPLELTLDLLDYKERTRNVNLLSHLLQRRIKKLMMEGYTIDGASMMAGNEIYEFFGDETRGVRFDLKKYVYVEDVLSTMIFQGKWKNNDKRLEAFQKDFEDGSWDDVETITHGADYMLKNLSNSIDERKKFIFKKYLGVDACDSVGQKIFVTNQKSAYYGDSLFCRDEYSLYWYTELDDQLGPCIPEKTPMQCVSDSLCYLCTYNDGWTEAAKSVRLEHFLGKCYAERVDPLRVFSGLVYKRKKYGYSRYHTDRYQWEVETADTLGFYLGRCSPENSCEIKEHTDGIRYVCRYSKWKSATEENEFCRVDSSQSVSEVTYKLSEEAGKYFACSRSACTLSSISKSDAEQFPYIEEFAGKYPCSEELDGVIGYYPQNMSFYKCVYKQFDYSRWKFLGVFDNDRYRITDATLVF